MNRLAAVALCLLAIDSAPCMKPAADVRPLECRIESIEPLVAGGPAVIRFQLTNPTAAPLWVLRWNTPFEGWRGTIFSVSFRGTELPYQGPMVKRGDPGREEYLEIPARESVSATVDLAEVYDIEAPGEYRVEVEGGLQDVANAAAAVPRPRDRQQPMELRCQGIALDVKSKVP
jgi:peptidyl-Lys metalloendopeptidase